MPGKGPKVLDGKVAIVTGTSPNVTGGIAYGLAEEGATVFCVDRRVDYARGCAAGIRSGGGVADAAACDVTDETAVQQAVELACQRFGRIDILVNGAAVSNPYGLLDMDAGEFRSQLDCILTGTFLFTKHAATRMIAQGSGGAIVNLGSTEGHQGNPGNIAYGTGKGGLVNFTRAAAMELACHQIRVNLLTPTGTDPSEGLLRAEAWRVPWERSRRAQPRPEFTTGAVGVPLRRQPTPRDYARALVFLVSDDAAMITGSDLRVDGGVLSRYWRWNPGVGS